MKLNDKVSFMGKDGRYYGNIVAWSKKKKKAYVQLIGWPESTPFIFVPISKLRREK